VERGLKSIDAAKQRGEEGMGSWDFLEAWVLRSLVMLVLVLRMEFDRLRVRIVMMMIMIMLVMVLWV
jgi:hypothetical protein